MSKSFLIIDDELYNRKLLKIILKKLYPEAKIFEAEDGNEAVKIVKNYPLDLVLLDILLPDINGLEILKHIDNQITVIIITALEEDNLLIQKSSNIEFIQKPINVEHLKKVIKKALEK